MSRYDDLSDEARTVLDEMEAPTMADVIVTQRATVARVRQWADGPCPNGPGREDLVGDLARGYVRAMDDAGRLLDATDTPKETR